MLSRSGKFLICVCGAVFALGRTGVFAQTTDCSTVNVCWSAPKEFTMLMDMSRELINAIKTLWTEGNYLGKPVNPNRFKWATFDPPKQNILNKAGTALKQTLSFITATTAILASPQQWGGVQDLLAGIIALFKGSVFTRDIQAVDRIDSALTQKRYEVWVWWGRLVKVNTENVQMFQAILDAYRDKWLLKEGTVTQDVTYTAILGMVGSILTATKTYLSLNTTDGFDAVQNFRNAGIKITFNDTIIPSMTGQYDCARWSDNICAKSFKNFKENMKKIGSGAVKDAKDSIKIFSDAAKRLVQTFSKTKNQDSTFKAREQDLLKSYYGSQKVRSGGSLVSATMDNGWIFSQRRSTAVQDKTENTSTVDKTRSETPTTFVINTKDFRSIIKGAMLPIMEEQKRDLELVNFSDMSDVSAYFDGLWVQIAMIQKILWNKDTNGTLIKELGTACELQCGSISKKCR